MASLLTKVHVRNPELETLESDMRRRSRDLRSNIQYAKENLVGKRRSTKSLNALKRRDVLDLIGRLSTSPDMGEHALYNELYDYRERLLNGQQNYTSIYNDTRRHINQLRRSLDNMKQTNERLLRENPGKDIHINDIKIALVDNPNIDVDKTYLYHNPVNMRPLIQVRFHGLQCTPLENSYSNIFDSSFPLRDVNVIMDLKDNSIFMKRANLHQPAPKGYTSNRRVHPHILENDKPCMGDFLGAYADARDQLNIVDMVAIAQLFLESANPEDAAGTYWPRWAFYNAKYSRGNLNLLNETRAYNITDDIRIYAYKQYTGIYRVPILKDGALEIKDVHQDEIKPFCLNLADEKLAYVMERRQARQTA